MTIGVLVSGLYEEYNRGIAQGIWEASQDDDVRLVLITGKYLDFDLTKALGMEYEYQYNTCFSYGKEIPFDGLIIDMASTTMFSTKEGKRRFAESFSGIPRVYISYEMEGCGSVFIDNAKGLCDALENIYQKGIRKYSMIGGPVDNPDAIERKQIFYSFLKEHGLDTPDTIYEDGDFILDCTKQIQALLDRNPQAEAVIAANDILARKACDILAERGVVVGQDMVVLGYDDSIAAMMSKPTISSVRNDFSILGATAYREMMEILSGKTPKKMMVPTQFLERESTMWKSEPQKTEKVLPQETAIGFRQSEMEAFFAALTFEEVLRTNRERIARGTVEEVRAIYEAILTTILSFRESKENGKSLLDRLDRHLDRAYKLDMVKQIDVSRFMDILMEGVGRMLKDETDPDVRGFVQKILLKLNHSLMDQINCCYNMKCFSELYQDVDQQLYYRDTFSFEHGDDSAYAQILSRPGYFGIHNAWLYVYEEEIINLPEDRFEPPKKLLLKAFVKDGQPFSVPAAEQTVRIEELLDNRFMDGGNQKELVMLPLYVGEVLYGVLISDMEREAFLSSGTFVYQTSSAIKLLRMLRENERLLAKYEDMLQVLESNNIRLEKLSKLDALTGLVNRRGFSAQIEKLYEEACRTGKALLVIYADMNNLKIINDRFGHDDGDFALEQIGVILKTHFDVLGVAGRIGGDEFACAAICENDVSVDCFVKELYARFTDFNQQCEKPYKIEIAAGATILYSDSDMTLEEALTQADENLYKEKKLRSKNIMKADMIIE